MQKTTQAVGAVFLLVDILGFIPGITSTYDSRHDSGANFVPVNNADYWLHLLLGLAMIALAILLSRDTRPREVRTGPQRPGLLPTSHSSIVVGGHSVVAHSKRGET